MGIVSMYEGLEVDKIHNNHGHGLVNFLFGKTVDKKHFLNFRILIRTLRTEIPIKFQFLKKIIPIQEMSIPFGSHLVGKFQNAFKFPIQNESHLRSHPCGVPLAYGDIPHGKTQLRIS